jgi:glycosyltransferase involved in cell wall biosynthesis
MVEQLGVRHEVKFLGEVSTDRLMSVYAQSHIFALPSKYESHSMALTEAMGFGLAPIATDVGGNPFLISEGCGFIVSYPIEEEELSSALNKLLENYELVQEIGKRARAKAKSHFDITKSLKRLEQTYIDLTA